MHFFAAEFWSSVHSPSLAAIVSIAILRMRSILPLELDVCTYVPIYIATIQFVHHREGLASLAINLKTGFLEDSALTIASQYGQCEIQQEKVDLLRKYDKRCVLSLACSNRHIKMAELLQFLITVSGCSSLEMLLELIVAPA